MAIALVQSKRTYASPVDTNIVLAFDSNITSGNLILAAIGGYDDVAFISISDSRSTSYTQAGSMLRNDVPSFATDTMLGVWYGIASSSGANTVTISFTAGVVERELKIWEISGINTSTPFQATNGTTGTAAAVNSGSITTTGETFIMKVMQEWDWDSTHDHAAGTPSSGWTEFGDTATGSDSAYRIESSGGTFDGGFTLTSTDAGWCCRVVAFSGAAAAAATSPGWQQSRGGYW